ncbi:MAG TPA: PspC domain-containing protein [Allosphingosinicella sp.]|jgi:phage shock protein PspC (stress-responsive transcriptional regulator)
MATYRSILARDDTLLGFCFAIADDFGFNPLYLRILFAVVLFWSPTGAFGGYALLGAVVALSRWLAPDPVAAEAAAEVHDEPCDDFQLAA